MRIIKTFTFLLLLPWLVPDLKADNIYRILSDFGGFIIYES